MDKFDAYMIGVYDSNRRNREHNIRLKIKESENSDTIGNKMIKFFIKIKEAVEKFLTVTLPNFFLQEFLKEIRHLKIMLKSRK